MAHRAAYSILRCLHNGPITGALQQPGLVQLTAAAAAAATTATVRQQQAFLLHQLRRLSTSLPSADLDAEVAVIGAGVVGLAIARELALRGRSVLLLEAGPNFGMETSSRNSEVIHAGLYYPQGSLKARLCVAGKQALYAFGEAHDVPHRRLGKLLVATSEAQLPALDRLRAAAAANGVQLQPLSGAQVAELEPAVRCVAALLSPTTGILDSHSFMAELHRQFEEAGGTTAFHARVEGGSVGGPVKRLRVRDAGSGEEVELATAAVVNAAGLHAQAVAASLQGLPPASIPPLHLAKGNYFTLAAGSLATMGPGGSPARFRPLIYPLPEPGTAGLGTHLTLDMSDGVRFGPDVEWLPAGTDPRNIDYTVSPARAEPFYAAIRAYLPGLPDGALQPAYSGVRPKVVGPGQPAGDFVVAGPRQHGVQGLACLFVIESPGLTSALPLAQLAATRLDEPPA
ncbi:hypothetical protein ABPG75_006274 [Micractinium tetrahymenae]